MRERIASLQGQNRVIKADNQRLESALAQARYYVALERNQENERVDDSLWDDLALTALPEQEDDFGVDLLLAGL